MKYTKVCGRVRGYQDSTTDAFEPYHSDNSLSLNDGYVDGVSITQGQPRKHIWTFAAGIHDTRTDGFGCPCTSGTFTGTVPQFITSASQESTQLVTESLPMIHSGMDRTVPRTTNAALTEILHGSAGKWTPQLPILNCEYAQTQEGKTRTYN